MRPRAVGPALGGVVVAAAGAATAFLLNAISFIGVVIVLARWQRPQEASVLPAERLLAAMKVGVRHVRHSPAMRAVFVRATVFIIGGSALWALLPVVTRADPVRGATAYGVLLGSLGVGAVIGAGFLPALRQRFGSTVEEGHALQPTLPNEGSRRTSTMRVQLGTYDQSNHSLFCLISCRSDSA